ncbi:cell division protein DivIVA [Terracoccus luteus]|uniref:DivIVA domain-containing protein n=1 Tax=Terracoccus luteus TaxID=53356 RepID=A0A839PNV8_9MICO|nr:cell division protein DivIVA [Terracoccus luteus]MBB2985880.1 DivIVA domain-containing protein [Terracoccus luteus]MCP2171532.1 DivIVA domain-containing protein [Terracoccus luteus]
MTWFILLVGVVVLCGVVALLLGLVGAGGMGRPTASLRHEPLPEQTLTDADLDALTFDVGARGYRMTQVDGVLDRLRCELREKDEQIAVLRGDGFAAPTEGPVEPVEPAEPAVRPEADGSTQTQDAGEPAGAREATPPASTR